MAEPAPGRGRKGRARNPRGTPFEAEGGMGSDHSFTLQTVMEVQKSVGSLEKAVEVLSGQVDRQQRTITWMARALWIGTGAALILGSIVTWIITNRFDEILNALAKSGG